MRVAFVILQIYFVKVKNIFIFSFNLHASLFHILLSLFHTSFLPPDISSLPRLLLSLLLLCLISTNDPNSFQNKPINPPKSKPNTWKLVWSAIEAVLATCGDMRKLVWSAIERRESIWSDHQRRASRLDRFGLVLLRIAIVDWKGIMEIWN